MLTTKITSLETENASLKSRVTSAEMKDLATVTKKNANSGTPVTVNCGGNNERNECFFLKKKLPFHSDFSRSQLC